MNTPTPPPGLGNDPTIAAPAGPPQPPPEIVYTLSSHFFLVSLKRAFRLAINPDEVLASERLALERSAAHITDRDHQAFLAWRRSVLLVVALAFVPLTLFRFIEAFEGNRPSGVRAMFILPALAEALFCMVAFYQLKNWTRWAQQRRILLIAWLLYFAAPFLIYWFPFRTAFDESVRQAREAAEVFGIRIKASRGEIHMVVGMVFGIQALISLAPKVISLMPGLIRASIVTKLMFPGTTAPGWLMVLAAPIYALFAYILVLLPYQVTGSLYFVAGSIGLIIAQTFISLSGRKLTVPLSRDEAHARIHRYWLAYIIMLVIAASTMVVGLYDFIKQVDLGVVTVISSVLSVIGNVLVLTLIGTDSITANMQKARIGKAPDPVQEALRRDAEAKLDVFCR